MSEVSLTAEHCHIAGCGRPAYISDRDGAWCRTHWDEQDKARQAEERRLTAEDGGPWPQTCPRRMGELGPWDRDAGKDTWDIREQFHHGIVARHCSFCGSLHPEDFLRMLEERTAIEGPTTKGYKVYVKASDGRETKFYAQHFSAEQWQRYRALHTESE